MYKLKWWEQEGELNTEGGREGRRVLGMSNNCSCRYFGFVFSIAPLEDTKYYSTMADFNLNLGTGGSCGHRQLS